VQPSADERRAEPRHAAAGGVRLVLKSGHALDAELVDRSLKGMRVRLGDAGALSPEVSVLSVANAAVYEARVVWRSPPYAGLVLTRTVDMRAPATARDAKVQRMWREHARG
jgi:hypothetical protein